VRHAVTSRQQQQQLADRPLGIGADVVMPDADGCDFSERRNRSNDEHVGMTSLKDGKQRASETMCRTSTKLTFKQQRHNSQDHALGIDYWQMTTSMLRLSSTSLHINHSCLAQHSHGNYALL